MNSKSISRQVLGLALLVLACNASCKSAGNLKADDILKTDQYCGYEDAVVPNRLTILTGNDYRPKTLINRITSFSGLPDRFLLRYAQVPNAAAAIVGDQRYILLNPKFMKQAETAAGTNWATVAILAHEVGHHLSGHTFDHQGSRPERELEADQYSGYVLNLMGASLHEAQSAMKILPDPTVVTTHPKRADRLQAIANGWRMARKNKQPAAPGLTHATVLTPEEKTAYDRTQAEEKEQAEREAARLRDEEEKRALFEQLTPIAEFRDAMWTTETANNGSQILLVKFTLDVRNAQEREGLALLLFSNERGKFIRDKKNLWTGKEDLARAAHPFELKSKNLRFPHVSISFPLQELDLPAQKNPIVIYPIIKYYEKRDKGVFIPVKQIKLRRIELKVVSEQNP